MNAPTAIGERLTATGTANALETAAACSKSSARWRRWRISITVRPGERRAVLGSNGAGQDDAVQLRYRGLSRRPRTIRFFGEDITALPTHERIRRGLRRTYQISLLFAGLTVSTTCISPARRLRGAVLLLRPGATSADGSAENLVRRRASRRCTRHGRVERSATAAAAARDRAWRCRARLASFCSTNRRPGFARRAARPRRDP